MRRPGTRFRPRGQVPRAWFSASRVKTKSAGTGLPTKKAGFAPGSRRLTKVIRCLTVAFSQMPYSEDRSSWFEGQGLWQHVPAAEWRDGAWQLKNRITSKEQLERYMTLTEEEKAGCEFANKKLALAITPYFFNLIDRADPDCPIRKQVIPSGAEMLVSSDEMLDSLGEDAHSP